MDHASSDSDRYSRQVLFPPIGRSGQEKLLGSKVALVGLGALGATLAEMMVRAGIGDLRLIDRDIVEASNLGRQSLYTARDAAACLPKAAALARHLADINPGPRLEPRVADLNAATAVGLLGDRHLILDGSDNFEARYLINDLAVSRGLPWIYGACVGARGMTAVILPGSTPCLRCLFPEPPPPGSTETCDTAGIIAPAANLVASLQAAEALKILVGDLECVRRSLVSIELWPFRIIELGGAGAGPAPGCPACGERRFPFLEGGGRPRVLTYCGRNAVQIVPAPGRGPLDLAALKVRLAAQFPCRLAEYVLRVELPGHSLTVFDDGRALVSGTGDPERARSLYDRYVGS